MGGLDLIFIGLLVAVLMPIALVDLREQRIPNSLNLGLALVGFLHSILRRPAIAAAFSEILHGTAACAVFALTVWLMRLANRRAYIGWGDVKFLVAISFWVGADGSVAVLLGACLIHIGVVLASIPWRGLEMQRMRPFGPMLAAATLCVVVAVFLQEGTT